MYKEVGARMENLGEAADGLPRQRNLGALERSAAQVEALWKGHQSARAALDFPVKLD